MAPLENTHHPLHKYANSTALIHLFAAEFCTQRRCAFQKEHKQSSFLRLILGYTNYKPFSEYIFGVPISDRVLNLKNKEHRNVLRLVILIVLETKTPTKQFCCSPV